MPDSPLPPDLFVSFADAPATPAGECAADGCRVVPPAAARAPDLERRFGGLDRLYGDGARAALSHLHVVVAGIGGVGAWCVEALARSGVGALTLVDLDHIAESNINRQIHALGSTLGRAKVLAMADRIRDIHPGCRVRCVDDFVAADNLAGILVLPDAWPADADETAAVSAGGPARADAARQGTVAPERNGSGWASCLVDCTDQVAAKIAMVLQARALSWPVLVCGGAGGKTDPLALRMGDLSVATHDALLARVRQGLRKHHGYPKGGAAGGKPRHRVPRMGVSCLWFDQPVILPAAWTTVAGQAPEPMAAAASALTDAGPPLPAAPQGLSCAGYGSIVTVTATMGMAAANWAIQRQLLRTGADG